MTGYPFRLPFQNGADGVRCNMNYCFFNFWEKYIGQTLNVLVEALAAVLEGKWEATP